MYHQCNVLKLDNLTPKNVYRKYMVKTCKHHRRTNRFFASLGIKEKVM